jgi:hypothetical protein
VNLYARNPDEEHNQKWKPVLGGTGTDASRGNSAITSEMIWSAATGFVGFHLQTCIQTQSKSLDKTERVKFRG